jgi:peptidoglycan/xylan/chitin deacetylase (PgdA/CDA1 family)
MKQFVKICICIFWMAGVIFCSCQKNMNGPSDEVDYGKTVVASRNLIKTGDSTEIQIQIQYLEGDQPDYSWSVDHGSLVHDGNKALFKAPLDPCTATIRIRVTEKGHTIADSVRILVYKQIIILKADDLQLNQGSLLSREWLNFINLVKNKKIKASLGLIGNTLENMDRQSLKRLKDLICDDQLEIWNHGYDHVIDQVDDHGDHYWEFKNTNLEHQRQHILMTQELAKDKLGIVLKTFGAPGNAFDQNTQEALDSIDDIKVWFFGSDDSTKLVLRRFAEIEFPTHYPDYNKFIGNYISTKDYLALQIHPNSWDAIRLNEFEKIVDFLVQQKATFLTPFEFYRLSK